MRVLMASKFWYLRGGLERVMFDEIALLEAAGHEVVHFSTSHPLNDASPWADAFAPYLEIGAGARIGAADKARAVARMFRNRPAARAFGRLLDATRPDVVHVHGIHRQLSPSILLAAARRSIPVVHTLHDYHLVCPADVMLRGGATTCIPRACGTVNCVPAIRNRCTRGSLGASAIAAAELSFQRITRAYERSVTRFISPSRFVRDLMIDGGWTRTPIDVLAPGVPLPERVERTPGEYLLYAGRLSPEKGLGVFLEAARAIGAAVIVAGDGPLAEELRRDHPEVQFTGHVGRDQISRLLGNATASVVPSISLENTPLGVLEAMASGVPVVASGVGGIPELIDDGVEGLLVPPGDAGALSASLTRILGDRALAASIGEAGRSRIERDFAPERHRAGLLEVYARATGDIQ
ncbi:MAG: glycosyltransferase family 4 protein [Coriobacteriia bacterium]